MILSQPVLVRPRAVSPHSGETFPLAELVGELLVQPNCRLIQLLGGPGSGKSTALALLAREFAASGAVFLDDPSPPEIASHAAARHVVCTGRKPLETENALLRLAPWTDDDLIECLRMLQPAQCGAVFARVAGDPDKGALAGNPALWRIALDELLADEEPSSLRKAVLRGVGRTFRKTGERRLAGAFSLAILLKDNEVALRTLGLLSTSEADFERFRALRHPFVQQLLGGERLARLIEGGGICPPMWHPLPEPLVREVARHAHSRPALLAQLQSIFDGTRRADQAQAGTILFAADRTWRPKDDRCIDLTGGNFPDANWANLRIPNSAGGPSSLADVNLARADLRGAVLEGVRARGVRLTGARLSSAVLLRADFRRADLCGANLAAARADNINFTHADLRGANFEAALLQGATFENADLRGASFRGAILVEANLVASQIENADFQQADLCESNLVELPLRLANLTEARFARADLSRCDLEGIAWDAADFHAARLVGAWLTGSVLPRADFGQADLRETGLADIQWERADLRGADLRGCTFHMGSTRSGLVGSPYPGHGSKTGFYTDDYFDQGYKIPEEIRKADLRGADLRGAKLDGVDFYLVDLRGAKLDADVVPHLRRCGAILADRVRG